MGLFGGGNSERTSNNYDNRTINDYGGSTFDSSNNGQFAGVSGDINYTTVDGGAFDVVNSSNEAMAGIASESLSLANSLGSNAMQYGYELGTNGLQAGVELSNNSQNFALSAISENSNLVRQYGDLSTTMLDRTLSSNDSVMNNTAEMLDNANSRTLDAALNITQTGLYQSELNNNFARDLFAQNGEAALAQQQDNNSALNNGFKSMMQFADSFSRSDGAAIAKDSNKMVMVMVAGVVIAMFVMKKGK